MPISTGVKFQIKPSTLPRAEIGSTKYTQMNSTKKGATSHTDSPKLGEDNANLNLPASLFPLASSQTGAGATLLSIAEAARKLDLKPIKVAGAIEYHGANPTTASGAENDGFWIRPDGTAYDRKLERSYSSKEVAQMCDVEPAHYEPFATWLATQSGQTGVGRESRGRGGKGGKADKGAPVETATYIYHNGAGKPLFRVQRKKWGDGSKQFPVSRLDERGGWQYGLGKVLPVLYDLPAVQRAHTLFVCEGEKCADALNAALKSAEIGSDYAATTAPFGAGKWEKWAERYAPDLTGKRVWVLPDADTVGERHAQTICRLLHGLASSIAIVRLPDLPAKGDVCDYLQAGGSVAALFDTLEDTPIWTPDAATAEESDANDVGAVAWRRLREKRDEPTPDEISATAEAVEVQVGGSAHFPERKADALPSPALLTGEKPEYDPHQLRVLLYPNWQCIALETEKAHAERAVHYVGDDLLFCPELGFLHFQPAHGRWRKDDKEASLTIGKLGALAPAVRAEAAALLRHAATLAMGGRDGDARAMSRAANKILIHAKSIEKRSFLAGASTFLSAQRRAEVTEFAPRGWCFAWANGRTFVQGELRATTRDDNFLNVSPVALEDDADGREWNALLDRITGGNPNFARTLQDVAAYAVSGASSLRALLWCYGPRGTGKSTFCELLQTLLGEDSATIDTALLQANSSRERLGATLWGKRAAFVSEAGNKRIDAELLKMLSGGDRLSVRFLYREAFTAPPSHCLILAANDAPQTDAYDDALKDRVIALPFVHPLDEGARLEFQGHQRLESARRDAASPLVRGFALWVAQGLAQLYQRQDIYRAPVVVKATTQFWADTDPLTPFWETIEAETLSQGIPKTELRRLYESWCITEGANPVRPQEWSRACESLGLAQVKRLGVRYWVNFQTRGAAASGQTLM